MRIDILTLFPEVFSGFLQGSLLGAAHCSGLIDIRTTNIRDFSTGTHHQVDDRPYGGGPGMLLMPGPVVEGVEFVKSSDPMPSHVVMLSPSGRRLEQSMVEEFSKKPRLLLLCGRYEGFDDRVREILQPDEVSIGDYVLSGGEVAAMVLIEAIARLLPGVLGDPTSALNDSFSGDERLVEGAQYTRPREFRGLKVPDVLLSGDHGTIAKWRLGQSVQATRRRTPTLTNTTLSATSRS